MKHTHTTTKGKMAKAVMLMAATAAIAASTAACSLIKDPPQQDYVAPAAAVVVATPTPVTYDIPEPVKAKTARLHPLGTPTLCDDAIIGLKTANTWGYGWAATQHLHSPPFSLADEDTVEPTGEDRWTCDAVWGEPATLTAVYVDTHAKQIRISMLGSHDAFMKYNAIVEIYLAGATTDDPSQHPIEVRLDPADAIITVDRIPNDAWNPIGKVISGCPTVTQPCQTVMIWTHTDMPEVTSLQPEGRLLFKQPPEN